METSEFKGAFGKLVEKKSEEHGEYLAFVPNKLPPKFEYSPQVVLVYS